MTEINRLLELPRAEAIDTGCDAHAVEQDAPIRRRPLWPGHTTGIRRGSSEGLAAFYLRRQEGSRRDPGEKILSVHG
jgi:hypothetical protein